jgi:midasin
MLLHCFAGTDSVCGSKGSHDIMITSPNFSLANSSAIFEDLMRTSRRLNLLSSELNLRVFAVDFPSKVIAIKNSLCRVRNSLAEVCQAMQSLQNLQCEANVQEVARLVELAASTTTGHSEALGRVLDDVTSVSTFPILSSREHMLTFLLVHLFDFRHVIGEYDLIREALEHIRSMPSALQHWATMHPLLAHVLAPAQNWLIEETTHLTLPESLPSATRIVTSEPVINSLLMTVQRLLAKCSDRTHDEQLNGQDRYIREGARVTTEFTTLLNLQAIRTQMQSTFHELSGCSVTVIHDHIKRFLPFLSRYLCFAEGQLVKQSQWVKALFKLSYVLCSLLHTLAKDGFCKPRDSDDDSSGGDASAAPDGVGLGEGTGMENVSKEIEDESQVEGLQREEEDDTGETPKPAGDDDAIEMDQDLGGDLEDVPDAGSDDGREMNEDGQDDLDKQLENLDPSDPSALDEKIWGDEGGPSDNNAHDDKANEDISKHSESSDVVAKEGAEPSKMKDQGSDDNVDAGEEQSLPDDRVEEGEDYPNASGAPMDSHVPDADTLDLPEDLDLGPEDDAQEGPTSREADIEDDEICEDGITEDVGDKNGEDGVAEDVDDDHLGDGVTGDVDDAAEPHPDNQDDSAQNAVAQPDISAGDGLEDGRASDGHKGDPSELAPTNSSGETAGVGKQRETDDKKAKQQETRQVPPYHVSQFAPDNRYS